MENSFKVSKGGKCEEVVTGPWHPVGAHQDWGAPHRVWAASCRNIWDQESPHRGPGIRQHLPGTPGLGILSHRDPGITQLLTGIPAPWGCGCLNTLFPCSSNSNPTRGCSKGCGTTMGLEFPRQGAAGSGCRGLWVGRGKDWTQPKLFLP